MRVPVMVSAASSSIVVVTRDDLRELLREAVREGSKDKSEPEILTLDQVADLLQVTTVSVRKYMLKQNLPAMRLGPREWRFRRSEILKWLDEEGKAGR